MAEVGLIWADDADLKAVYNYVQRQRPLIPKFPELQSKIEDFEHWYQGLSWSDIHVFINDTIAEAFRRRDEINRLTENVLPADWVSADRRDRAPGVASGLSAAEPPKPPWIPTWAKVTVLATATLAGIVIIAKKFTLLRFL